MVPLKKILRTPLQVLFIHKYSSKLPLDTTIYISSSYFCLTAMTLYSQHLTLPLPEPPIDLKTPGIFLFLVGITGNLHHHYLLSKTRAKGETEYRIPKGGLFGLVVCPHYPFEIIEFFGLSLISQTLYPICFTLGSGVYLMRRSYDTREWYISKFEDFPMHIKAIIPFVF